MNQIFETRKEAEAYAAKVKSEGWSARIAKQRDIAAWLYPKAGIEPEPYWLVTVKLPNR